MIIISLIFIQLHFYLGWTIEPWLCLDSFNNLSDFRNIGIYDTRLFLQFQWIIQRRYKNN